jgi:predicted small lipoprotein YifL
MITRWLLAVSISLALALPLGACGTKSNLDLPNGKASPKDERDPSRPPQPIGR